MGPIELFSLARLYLICLATNDNEKYPDNRASQGVISDHRGVFTYTILDRLNPLTYAECIMELISLERRNGEKR